MCEDACGSHPHPYPHIHFTLAWLPLELIPGPGVESVVRQAPGSHLLAPALLTPLPGPSSGLFE